MTRVIKGPPFPSPFPFPPLLLFSGCIPPPFSLPPALTPSLRKLLIMPLRLIQAWLVKYDAWGKWSRVVINSEPLRWQKLTRNTKTQVIESKGDRAKGRYIVGFGSSFFPPYPVSDLLLLPTSVPLFCILVAFLETTAPGWHPHPLT